VFLILIVAYLLCIIKAPIICGREPAATAEEKKLGAERTAELSAKVNQVIFFLGLSV
jgi:DNA repair and recombination protein RAD54 and RAD54-like protein